MPSSLAHSRRLAVGRRGDAIVEALVATMLLTVGALALLSLTAVLLRDERRAATRWRAAALMEERLAAWRSASCDAGAGSRTVGALRESWSAARAADSLEVLVDSVAAPADPAQGALTLVALRGCAP